MSSHTWTDILGRTYEFEPYAAESISDLEIATSEATTFAVAEASRALGTVPSMPGAGVAAVLYRSESSASSIIEDITVGPRRILEAEVAREDEIRDPIAERIIGNLKALRDAFMTPFPASPNDYLRWHSLLMEGHPRLAPESVGAYRSQQNWIGGDSYGPRNAEFVPPPPEEVMPLMEDLARYTARTDIAPVIQAAVAHARFEVIHPFVDGNGRVGRMLIQHVLAGRLRIPAPVPVSVPWSRDTDSYIVGLRSFQNGDLDRWIEFAAMSIVDAVRWMHTVEQRLTALLISLEGRSRARGDSVAARVIRDLAVHPLIDAETVANRYGVSRQAAHEALTRLSEDDVLGERSFSRRTRAGRPRRMLSSTELIDLLSEIVTE
ncbi:MAG: Fic family protein [Actinomycetota bacterium]|nr:Fic family protein [Actinomycetota bacterium]